MSGYVDFVTLWHPEYTGVEGRVFKKEDGETRESLAARGWVDDPAKLGLNPWGESGQRQVDKTYSDYKAGMLPAIEDPELGPVEIARAQMQKMAQEHQAEVDELYDRIRQKETPAEQVKRSKERLMDEKSENKTLPKNAASKPNKSGSADHA